MRPLYLAKGKEQLMVMDPASWATMQESLLKAKIITKEADLSKVVYADLLDEAKALL